MHTEKIGIHALPRCRVKATIPKKKITTRRIESHGRTRRREKQNDVGKEEIRGVKG